MFVFLEYVLEWVIRLTMLAIVPLRRQPAAASSWLLLIFFFPVPGLLLYLAIGSPRFPKWRAERFASFKPHADAIADVLRQAPPSREEPAEIARLAERLGNLPATGGNSIEFLGDYDETIERIIADIDVARRHVRITAYIFADDVTGRKIVDALRRACARGVICHVLIDPVGSRRWFKASLKALERAGVNVRAALPFSLLRARTRRDMRNHRKLYLIDGETGYAGSQNIVDRDFRPGVINRELVARVTGPAVLSMEAVFLGDWFLETEEVLETRPPLPAMVGSSDLQILPTSADFPIEGFQTLITWQIGQAESEVVIVTPYLIPDQALLVALATAALRGVDVRIVVSAVVDQQMVSLAQSSYYDELLSLGVRIHRHRDYLLHAKSARIDGRLGVVGSSNVDIRSFQLNEEVSLLIYDAAKIAELGEIQRDYIRLSDEMDLATWRKRSRARKLVENLARLVSPLL